MEFTSLPSERELFVPWRASLKCLKAGVQKEMLPPSCGRTLKECTQVKHLPDWGITVIQMRKEAIVLSPLKQPIKIQQIFY